MLAAALLLLTAVRALASTYMIKQEHYDLCLDNTDGKVVAGNPVQVWTCIDDNTNQWWDFTPGKYPTTIVLHGTNFCLTATPAANGSPLSIAQCNGDYSQLWSGPISPKFSLFGTNYCIDLTNGDSDPGNKLQVWTYYPGNTNQEWTWEQVCA